MEWLDDWQRRMAAAALAAAAEYESQRILRVYLLVQVSIGMEHGIHEDDGGVGVALFGGPVQRGAADGVLADHVHAAGQQPRHDRRMPYSSPNTARLFILHNVAQPKIQGRLGLVRTTAL